MALSPAYTIHQYREDIYKVVAFKGNRDPDKVYVRDREDNQRNETKLDSNFSRARSMVLQYALCNPWEYFFTGTLDQTKWRRDDLDTFMRDFSQKIRDWRKEYGFKLDVLLVPEKHKDGMWHVHGLINNLPYYYTSGFYWLPLPSLHMTPYPFKLCNGEFRSWPDFQDRYGYCSLARIRDPIATAYYVTKYIGKDIAQRERDLGKHLYFHSRPLKKAEKASDVYLYNPGLDDLCTHEYDFCKTGMVQDAPWYFPYVWDGAEAPEEAPLDPKPIQDPLKDFDPWTIDPFYEQLKMETFQ